MAEWISVEVFDLLVRSTIGDQSVGAPEAGTHKGKMEKEGAGEEKKGEGGGGGTSSIIQEFTVPLATYLL